MKIIKEGTIEIQPDGRVYVQGFHIEDGTLTDLWALVDNRVKEASFRLAEETVRARNNMFVLPGSAEADELWLGHLEAWRKTLCDELMTIKSPIRDPVTMARSRNLTLSIKIIDRGPSVIKDFNCDLISLRLGQLMIESGYTVIGANLTCNYIGELPWHGTIKETEKRLADLAKRCVISKEDTGGE